MKTAITNFRSPAIISSILVLPFVILEWVNRRGFDEDFPFPLFGIMWMLPLAFIVILNPVVRDLRAGNRLTANPAGLLAGAAILFLIGWLWTGILLDQMPCFLGVPNCD